nr:hypothetical protein BaRGS_008340 [Batillaria attramentaria]
MDDSMTLVNFSYLYCVDAELGWGNRSYFTFFVQFNRGPSFRLVSSLEAAALVLFFLLSSVANVLVFYTLSSNRRLRTVTNYFVCNLTLADVCFTLGCPFVAVGRVMGQWTLGSFACKTIVYLSFVCGFVTIWTLTLISIDRYTCIVRNTKHRITPSLALVLISIVWLLALAAFAPLLLYFVVKDCPLGRDTVSICTLGWPRTSGVSVAVLFTSLVCGLGFLVPVVVLIISHTCIFVKVHKVRKAMAQQRQRRFSTSSALNAKHVWTTANNHNNNSNSSIPPPSPTSPVFSSCATATAISGGTLDLRRRKTTRDIQVVKTLIYLVVLFFAMWAPIFVVFLLISRDAQLNITLVSSQAFLAAMCVGYCNAVVNPLAYGLSTGKLRGYLKRVMTCSSRLTTFNSYVSLIGDSTPGIVEKKLKAAQELSENFETVVNSPQYPQFLQEAMRVFLKILEEGEPQFIAEQNMQHLRKVLLEILHRIPCNEHLKKYIQPVLSLMFRLLKTDNEENVLVCIRIILELHKQFRPQMNEEIQDFLQFVKGIYSSLPSHLPKIFEPRPQRKVKDMTEINVELWLQDIYTLTPVVTDKKNADGQNITYNIIPRGVQSLKVLAELPIIVVLMYQLYKASVQPDMLEFIPLIMNTITLLAQTTPHNPVNSHSQQMVQGLLGC